MTNTTNEQGFISVVYEGKTYEDLHTCLFACFLSQKEPKKGYTQEEGIDYVEVFAQIARIEAIRLLKKNFMSINLEDPEFPDRVYKVEKALYGLHQALRAWYETLSIYLLDNRFQRGQIDKTLFIKRVKSDILLVQMSSMGELTFFLGLQVTQKDDGIFISQDKYVDEILKKFGFSTVKTASTPMETSKPLMKDENAKDVDVHLYRSMIGSLMYLTSLRPDIMFADLPFNLEAYTDSDYAGASLDRKSTTGGCQFLGSRLISWQCNKQTIVANSTTKAEYVAAASCYGQVLWIQNQMLDYGYNFMNTKIFIDNESTICIVKNIVFHSKTKHIEIRHHFIRDSNDKKLIQMIKIHTDQNVVDLLTKAFVVGRFQYLVATANDEIQVSAVGLTYYRYALTENPTIYVSLIKQFWETVTARTLDNEEIKLTATIDEKVKIVTKASIRRHLQLADSDGISSMPTTEIFEQLSLIGGNIDKTPTMTQDSPLPRVNTLRSDEGSMKLQELMVLYTTLSKNVESLETDLKQTKLTYGVAYTKLIKKVKKLKNKFKSNQARRRARIIVSDDEDDLEDPSKQGRKIAEIDQDPAISLVQHDAEIQGRHEHDMKFDFDLDAAKDVSTAEKDVSTAKPVSTAGAAVTTASVTTKTKLQQEQETLGYEVAVRLQAGLEEEKRQRIAKVHEAASFFNVEEWEDIYARVEADEELAQRLQAKEREMYTKAGQSRMLIELINQIKSHTLQQLRGYSFDEINNLLEIKMRRVHTFVPIKSEIERVVPELAAGSSKRDAEEELDQESSKRKKAGESSELAKEPKDKEEELSQEELQQMMIIVPKQGMNVEALQTKDGLVMLWSLVKERFNSTKPTDDKEREIWVEMKRLFEPDTDDELWKLQKYIHDLTWMLYDSCRVHHVSTEKGIDIYMLIEKEYPLSRGTLTQMLVAKLLVEQDNKMS
ncbi:putative ribonuclease H-like domain-containing protein [Tanacetum coccineum]|uniref:Ribonuclease H-like domain-containing protein n=1 Tax=Tanacetum coccineum TaxID=301880 RepID=A0ABQ5B305_9ASTR